MRLTKKISAIVLVLALLISSMSVFTVSAATDTALDITAFYHGGGSYGYESDPTTWQQHDGSSWRFFLYTSTQLTDQYANFGNYTVTWNNGDESGSTTITLSPQILEQGCIFASIPDVPAADGLADGAIMTIVAGTGTTDNGNSITLQNDVVFCWNANTQKWEYVATADYTTNQLVIANPTTATGGIYAHSDDSVPSHSGWSYRYYPVASQGGITLIRDSVETKLSNVYFQKFGTSAPSYYINIAEGGTTAQAGDIVCISGIFGLRDDTYGSTTAECYTHTFVEVQESKFYFDGTNWSDVYVLTGDEVVISYLDAITNHQSASAFYTSVPDTSIALTDSTESDWSNRFLPVDGLSGAYYNGTRFDIDGGNGLAYQKSAGLLGFYIVGFGTAVAGDQVTLKGTFASASTGEIFTLYAPVTFTYDGTTWTRTSEIPEMPIEYDNEYTGTLTVAGAQITTTNPAQLYLKGSDSLDAYKNGSGDVENWDVRLSACDGDENGVFFNGTKVSTEKPLFKYSDANNYWFAEGFTATTAGDIVIIKGEFVNEDQAAKVTIEESKFQWNGSQWIDYVEYDYNDFTVTGFNSAVGYDTYRGMYFNVDGTIPGNWDKFVGLQIAVDGGDKINVDAGNNGATNVVMFDVNYTDLPQEITTGTTLTIYAGSATPRSDASNVAATDAIRLTADFTMVWNGTSWVLPTAYTEYTGTLTVAGAQITTTNPARLYLKGSDSLDAYKNGSGDVENWDIRLSACDGDENGVFFNGTKVSTEKPLFKYSDANNYWFAEGFTATTAGDIVIIKGEFVNEDQAAKVTIEESKFQWDGAKWIDYIEYNYSDFTISGINSVTNDTANSGYWFVQLNVDGTIPGNWDKFVGLQFSVNGGDKQTVRMGNAGSTSVLCFDAYKDYLPGDIAEGTILTVHAGTATPASDATNVAATDAIRLTADFTMVWNGTSWVLPSEYVVYNDITMTGTVSPSGWNSGSSRWDFYITVDGTIPGVGDSGYSYTPAYVTVVDAAGNVLYNKTERTLGFSAHQTTLYFNFTSDELAQTAVSAGTVVTIYGGEMAPLSWGSIAYNDSGYQVGINVQNDLQLVYDGASWVPYVDRSGYTEYTGSVSMKGAETVAAPPHLYLMGSDTLDAVMKEAATAWNIAYVYPMLGDDNGIFLNDTKLSTNFQKYNGTNNYWYTDNINPTAVGDTLVIKGQFYNDTYQVLVTLAPLTLVWNGSAWEQRINATLDKDVNGDDTVDVRDAVLLQMYLADSSIAVSDKSDINDSDTVTSDDQRLLRRYLLGIIVTYVNDEPVGTPYYAGGTMLKTAFSAPSIGTFDSSTETVTFKSDEEIASIMKTYTDAGFTHIVGEQVAMFYDNAADYEGQKLLYRYLEEAEKYGLKVIVDSVYISAVMQQTTDIDSGTYSKWREVVDHLVSILDDYPAFWGFFLGDEPTGDEVANYLKVVPYIKENHPSVGVYWANFPNYVTVETITNSDLGISSYEDYVKVLGAGTGQFMYDSYVLRKSTSSWGTDYYLEGVWFSNLELVSSLARVNGFATGITMQIVALEETGTSGWFSKSYQTRQVTTEAEVGFQVYTALAYGMKELSYFTYMDHWDTNNDVEPNTAMIASDGSLQKSYHATQSTHEEIKQLEAALVNYNWKGTIALNLEEEEAPSDYSADSDGNDRLASVSNASGPLVIGCLEDIDGFDGFLVANASEPSDATTSSVTLTFNNATKAIVYIDGVAQEVTLTNGAYTVSVADGEGVFIIPIQ